MHQRWRNSIVDLWNSWSKLAKWSRRDPVIPKLARVVQLVQSGSEWSRVDVGLSENWTSCSCGLISDTWPRKRYNFLISPISYPLGQGPALVVSEQVHVGKRKSLILRAASLVAHTPPLDFTWAGKYIYFFCKYNPGEFFHLGCFSLLRTSPARFRSHPSWIASCCSEPPSLSLLFSGDFTHISKVQCFNYWSFT